MIFRRINKMWKYRQKKYKNHRRSEDKGESSRHKRFNKKGIQCYEYKEMGHVRSECPNVQKEKPKKRFEKRRGMMATWDDSKSSEVEIESEDERANLAFMVTTADDSASNSESEEVFSELTRNELEDSVSEHLEN